VSILEIASLVLPNRANIQARNRGGRQGRTPFFFAHFFAKESARARADEAELAAMPNIRLYPGMPGTVMIPIIQRTAFDYLVGPRDVVQAFVPTEMMCPGVRFACSRRQY